MSVGTSYTVIDRLSMAYPHEVVMIPITQILIRNLYRSIFLSTLALVCTVSTVSAQTNPPEIRSGGTITIGKVGVGSLVFHPLYLSLGIEKEIAGLIYGHGLLRQDETGKLIEGLAVMPTKHGDGLVWVFQLRPDVLFHDSEALTADDIVFTYELYKQSRRYDPIFHRYFRNIERLEKYDPWTVAFVMKSPITSFPVALATMPIVPRHQFQKRPFADAIQAPSAPRPIGLGPFKLEQRLAQNSVILSANREWHHGWPNLERIVYRFYTTSEELTAAFVLQEVDVVELDRAISFHEVKRARPDARIQAVTPGHRSFEAIFYNQGKALFNDHLVRRAMTHAIDRERVVRQVMTSGTGSLAHGPVAEEFWAFGGVDRIDYDPAEALKLLRRQGWRDSNGDGFLSRSGKEFTFELLFQKGSITSEKLVRIVKLNLNNIGVGVKPTPVELKELVQRMRIGAYDAAIFNQPFASTPDDFYAVFHSEGIPLGFNMLRYRNRQIDRNISFLYGITERARSLPIYKQLQLLLSRDQPCTFLYFIDREYIAFDPRFQNLGVPGASLNSPASWYKLTEPR